MNLETIKEIDEWKERKETNGQRRRTISPAGNQSKDMKTLDRLRRHSINFFSSNRRLVGHRNYIINAKHRADII